MNIIDRNEKKLEELIKNLYLEDQYLKRVPNLHKFDSIWKLSKILSFIDVFISNIEKDEINVLDIGGGAGLILKGVSAYLKKKYNKIVNKFALDLSPRILQIQQKKNPDLKKALNEDVRKTSLGNKEIDLSLMIDVLEHIPSPHRAFNEVKRISKYVILKVPLEDNLHYRIWNFIKKGERKQYYIENSGHINFYNYYKLKKEIKTFLGIIIKYSFTNVFEFLLETPYYFNNMNSIDKITNIIPLNLFKISPKLASLLFHDFIMILCECY